MQNYVKHPEAWKVPELPLTSHLVALDGKDKGRPEFTLLTHTARDQYAIAELMQATGKKNVREIAIMKPERVALYHTIADLQTDVKMNNPYTQLPRLTELVFEKHVQPVIKQYIMSSEYSTALEENRRLAHEAVARHRQGDSPRADHPYEKLAQDCSHLLHERIGEHYSPGKYLNSAPGAKQHSAGEALDWAVEALVYDQMCRDTVNTTISNKVEEKIQELINHNRVLHDDVSGKDWPLVRPRTPDGKDRQTFIAAGAPSTGKGTLVGMFLVDAEYQGISWDDVVQLSADAYRPIVAKDTKLDQVSSAEFTHDEVSIVKDLAVSRLKAKASQGRAPNAMFDIVTPSQDIIDYAHQNGGLAEIKVASAPPEKTVQWCYQRGQETGRFVNTPYQLSRHKAVSGDFAKVMARNMGTRTRYEVFDTDTRTEEMPTLIEQGNLQSRIMQIIRADKDAEFYGRQHINVKAEDESMLFARGARHMDLSHLKTIPASKITIYHKAKPVLSINAQKAVTIEDSALLRSALESKSFRQSVMQNGIFGETVALMARSVKAEGSGEGKGRGSNPSMRVIRLPNKPDTEEAE